MYTVAKTSILIDSFIDTIFLLANSNKFVCDGKYVLQIYSSHQNQN